MIKKRHNIYYAFFNTNPPIQLIRLLQRLSSALTRETIHGDITRNLWIDNIPLLNVTRYEHTDGQNAIYEIPP